MKAKDTNDTDRTVGLRIMTLRKANGMSQTELGQAIGVTFQQVQKYEKGLNRITSGRLQQIAQLFEVSIATLFGEEESTSHADAYHLLSTSGSVDLLRSYMSIENEQLRRDILQLVRTSAKMGADLIEDSAQCRYGSIEQVEFDHRRRKMKE